VLGHECIALAERKPRCTRIMYSRPGEMHSLHVEAHLSGVKGEFLNAAREPHVPAGTSAPGLHSQT
jgi:hypothetical protein